RIAFNRLVSPSRASSFSCFAEPQQVRALARPAAGVSWIADGGPRGKRSLPCVLVGPPCEPARQLLARYALLLLFDPSAHRRWRLWFSLSRRCRARPHLACWRTEFACCLVWSRLGQQLKLSPP